MDDLDIYWLDYCVEECDNCGYIGMDHTYINNYGLTLCEDCYNHGIGGD